MSTVNYETIEEFKPELAQALKFDIRDNPETKKILVTLAVKEGKAGEKEFLKILKADVERQFNKEPGPVLFPWTRAAIKTYITGGALHNQFGLGQWGSLIGSAITALAQVGSSIYGAKLQASTQLKITKIQVASADQQAAEERAVLERQMAEATAKNSASAPGSVSGNPAFASIMASPTSMMTMAGLLVGIGYIVWTKFK